MPEVKHYKQGELIFKEGDWGSDIFRINAGEVGIYSDWGETEEQQLAVLEAGRFFGEMGIIDVMPRSATAVAMTDLSVEKMSYSEFGQMYQNDPEMILMIFKNMTSRLRQLSDQYTEACDTITAYVKAEMAEKQSQGLRGKINKLIALGEKIGNTMV